MNEWLKLQTLSQTEVIKIFYHLNLKQQEELFHLGPDD